MIKTLDEMGRKSKGAYASSYVLTVLVALVAVLSGGEWRPRAQSIGIVTAFFHPGGSGRAAEQVGNGRSIPQNPQEGGRRRRIRIGATLAGRKRRGDLVRAWQQKQQHGVGGGEGEANAAAAAWKEKKRAKKDPIVLDDTQTAVQDVNVVLTHAICDFDSLASAVGLAKLWSHQVSHPLT